MTADNCTDFEWSAKRLKCAKLLAEGTKTNEEVAKECAISPRTLYNWKSFSEFLKKVDELTLAHEQATEAGLLRECYRGLNIKRKYIEDDKNTHLHYVQEIADLKGLKKQKVEHSGSVDTGSVVVYLPDNGREEKESDSQ
ncbi:phBC6A51 family helix-turn-helix protein [Methanococcoides sp. FTZ1]|uniref:phBC6A51 family helix-turn-helix protein n=1 Tax=Methanococcoides sp. FTZ1 TaxID=3439061 RepID=UPI003F829DE7